jgi:threonine dehydrogenase-like Zn-dependent dehydrogenase
MQDGENSPGQPLVKQAIMHGARDLRIEERPLDSACLETDQIFVQTLVTALSTGTDLGNYLGDSTYVPGAPAYPRAVGYSNVGVIRKIGSAVRRFTPGQRVFSTKPHMSSFLAREEDLLVPVPDTVSSEVASLSFLSNLGLAALRQAHYLPGENVAIVGLGVIGLCSTAVGKAVGGRVFAIANSPVRATLATRMGADFICLSDEPKLLETLNLRFGDSCVDIVILTANPWNAYKMAMDIVRRFGRVCLLGFPGRNEKLLDFNPLHPQWVYAKQLSIFGSGSGPQTDCPLEEVRFNTRRNLQYILALMNAGKLALQPLITHRLPAERMREAYELATSHAKELVTAVFDWQGME